MTDDTPVPFDLPAVDCKKLTVDFDGGTQSSDAGLLLREAERKLGVCRRLAAAVPDRRDPGRVQHEIFEMVMKRASAIPHVKFRAFRAADRHLNIPAEMGHLCHSQAGRNTAALPRLAEGPGGNWEHYRKVDRLDQAAKALAS